MKNLLVLIAVVFCGLALAGCSQGPDTVIAPSQDDQALLEKGGDTENLDPQLKEEYELLTSKRSSLVLNDFAERATIKSPLTLSGKVPTSWIFEGIFPIEIRTVGGALVAEGYGSATIFDEQGEIIDGLVEFSSEIIYENPDISETDLGILKLSQDATGLEELGEEQDTVEVLVIFG